MKSRETLAHGTGLRSLVHVRFNEVIRFLGYKKLREIDESFKNAKDFDTNVLMASGEGVPLR